MLRFKSISHAICISGFIWGNIGYFYLCKITFSLINLNNSVTSVRLRGRRHCCPVGNSLWASNEDILCRNGDKSNCVSRPIRRSGDAAASPSQRVLPLWVCCVDKYARLSKLRRDQEYCNLSHLQSWARVVSSPKLGNVWVFVQLILRPRRTKNQLYKTLTLPNLRLPISSVNV